MSGSVTNLLTLRVLVNLRLAVTFSFVLQTLLAVGAATETNRFVHPGLLQTRADLEFMKRQVAAGAEPWQTAWKNLLREPYSSMTVEPRAIAHVVRGAYGRPSVGDRELMHSAKAAYSQALQWWLTGDKAHAQKAISLLGAWSAVLADFHENDAKLLAGWTGHDFCNAAEILRYTGAEWAPEDLAQFKRMLLTVYYPLIKDFFPEANGNWDAAMIDTMLCIGVFCDDRSIFNRAVEHFRLGSVNGGITKYIYPSGQCQESTRDQGHTQLGLGELTLACQVAWNQGVDLYGAADNRLALGFEYTAKYMLGEPVPAFGTISTRARDRLSDIYEPVFQHYHCLKGLGLPWTERAVERTRTNSFWSAMVFYKGPRASPPGATVACPEALQAGALKGPTSKAPTDATRVSLGQSIQAALDGCRRHGGCWVLLASGVHTLPASLRIPNGVTLAGQGRGTVLFLDPKAATNEIRAAMVNAEPDLHDVTLRDLVIEGAASPTTSSDPNADRRRRTRPGAPRRAGIVFTAPGSNRMRRLHLEHVTVQNCTEDGVAIRRAAQVTISACDFSDNGSGTPPGAGPHHNLVIADVEGCELTDNRLDTSPEGCGLNLENGREVKVANSEAARNSRYGLRITGSRNVRVAGNLAEGNDSGGILLGGPTKACHDIDIQRNLCRNNGGYGLDVANAVHGALSENRLVDNSGAQQLRVASSEGITQR